MTRRQALLVVLIAVAVIVTVLYVASKPTGSSTEWTHEQLGLRPTADVVLASPRIRRYKVADTDQHWKHVNLTTSRRIMSVSGRQAQITCWKDVGEEDGLNVIGKHLFEFHVSLRWCGVWESLYPTLKPKSIHHDEWYQTMSYSGWKYDGVTSIIHNHGSTDDPCCTEWAYRRIYGAFHRDVNLPLVGQVFHEEHQAWLSDTMRSDGSYWQDGGMT